MSAPHDEQQLAGAQSVRFAEELRVLYGRERAERRRAEDALGKLEDSYAVTVRALAAALELRDDATGDHADRVARLALELAREVAPELAANPMVEFGFQLHDVGKIGIPDAILLKPGKLDPDELALMRRHPALGEAILRKVPHLGPDAIDTVRCHHERWDGGGYPAGLRGARIPLCARIFSLADAYDAMTNHRPYRPALSHQAAVEEIAAEAGSQFDPQLVPHFLSIVGRCAAA